MQRAVPYIFIGFTMFVGAVGIGLCEKQVQNQSVSQKVEEKKFTLVSRDLDVRDILQMIGRTAKINLIMGPDVKGKLSVSFRNTPPVQAAYDVCSAMELQAIEFDDSDKLHVIVSKALADRYAANQPPRISQAENEHKLSLVNRSFSVYDVFQVAGRVGNFNVLMKAELAKKLSSQHMAIEVRNVSVVTIVEALCFMYDLKYRFAGGAGGTQRTLHISTGQ